MAEIEDLKIVGGSTYTVGNQDIIAKAWEAGKTYVKNKSYVIQEHRLYVCNVTHTSVEPFDSTNWTEITIGEAIAENTTAIGDLSQITTTNVATTGYSTAGIDLVKCNKTVQFKFTGLSTMPSGGWTKIAQLPNGYFPQMEIIVDILDNSNRRVRFRLNIDGEVHVYNYGSTISSDFNSYVNFTYIVHS